MRTLFVAILMALAVVSCKQDGQSIGTQESIVGKWAPTYELFDESTQKWSSIQTLVALLLMSLRQMHVYFKTTSQQATKIVVDLSETNMHLKMGK
jgi:hypothetical protein